jgi:hypothetical protein
VRSPVFKSCPRGGHRILPIEGSGNWKGIQASPIERFGR